MKFSNSLYYPAFSVTMLFLVLAFIPQKEIKKIFWFSVLWGTGLDTVLVLLFKMLNLYHYVNSAPFDFYGSPILLNLAWATAVMLFLHFLPDRKEKYILPVYIAIYAGLGVFIGFFFKNTGLLVETHWHELLRFPLVYGCFFAGYKHYQSLKKRDSETI